MAQLCHCGNDILTLNAVNLKGKEVKTMKSFKRFYLGRILAATMLVMLMASSAFAAGFTHAGYQIALERFLKGGGATTTFQVGLTSATLTQDSALSAASAGEPSGNGYGRITVEQSGTGWTTSASDGNGWKLTSKNLVWTATGTWTQTVTTIFITDGTNLIAWSELSTPRALVNTDVLTNNFSLKLSN
jgi:hypothetical protein